MIRTVKHKKIHTNHDLIEGIKYANMKTMQVTQSMDVGSPLVFTVLGTILDIGEQINDVKEKSFPDAEKIDDKTPSKMHKNH
ncbi:hypothetical protein [Mycobacterium sp.]|uniref:hypothetical protein n=1 Tax=Mycobacterium sp. TaxID=1785 RepID=UPI0031D06797